MKFRYYAMRVDFNSERPVLFNIFDNTYVQSCCELAIKKYLRAPSKYEYLMFSSTPWVAPDETHAVHIYGFEAFKHSIKGILMHEYWARCQYEHLVTAWPPAKDPKMHKVDIWDQLEPNLECICYEIIRQYKLAKKTEAKTETIYQDTDGTKITEVTYHATDGTKGTLYFDEEVKL